MTRRKKPNPPDTKYFHYYNNNPKDRHVGDCAYRALALFLDVSWEEAARIAWDCYLETGCLIEESNINRIHSPGYMFTFNKMNIEYYLEDKFGCVCLPEEECKKQDEEGFTRATTIQEFIDLFAEEGETYLVSASKHFTVVKDKKVWDIVDCSEIHGSRYYIRKK